MGLESFQARAHDILVKESPSHVSTSADRPLEQNENNVCVSHEGALNCTSSSLLPSLNQEETAGNDHLPKQCKDTGGMHQNRPKTSPQNMPQYRNMFNDHARRNFCYWLLENKGSKCKGYSFGAYKTCLGLPKV